MTKINITVLLKNCPKGTELYSPIFGNVYLDEIRPHLAVVVRTSDKQKEEFLYDGRFGINGECMLFPSKENRNWSTLRPFKDGDVLAYQNPDYTNPSIYIHKCSQGLNTAFYVALSANGRFMVRGEDGEALYGNDPSARFATEEEKEKLFQAIKESGYKWNPCTKTLEKLIEPKFKVGDRIKETKSYISGIITDISDGTYKVEYKSGGVAYANIKFQDDWELVPNKFDITTLKEFDKVLVRGNVGQKWIIDFFGFMDKDKGYPFVCVGHYISQCIPYEQNKHLLNTTDDCAEYYKYWEE